MTDSALLVHQSGREGRERSFACTFREPATLIETQSVVDDDISRLRGTDKAVPS